MLPSMLAMIGLLAQALEKTFWLPEPASTYSGEVDWAFYFIYWVCVFFSLLIFFCVVLFTIRYRHTSDDAPATRAGHSTTLELTWTIIPTILVLVIFYFGFRSYMAQAVIPPNAYEITATGRMWNWSFTYPDGHVDSELHIPAGRPVRLVLTSQDVIHSLYIPAFRAKKDVVPGRYNRMWFQSDSPGVYQLYCAEYCGTSHSKMLSNAIVHDLNDSFEAESLVEVEDPATGAKRWEKQKRTIKSWNDWLAESRRPDLNYDSPAEYGKVLYSARGCIQCHSVDGSRLIGPSWKDLFNAPNHQMSDGSTVTVDENYIRESIEYPNNKIVAGYDAVMPSYQGSFKDVDYLALFAYMKSISSHYQGPEIQWDRPGEEGISEPGQDAGGAEPRTGDGDKPVDPSVSNQGAPGEPQTPAINQTAQPAPGAQGDRREAPNPGAPAGNND